MEHCCTLKQPRTSDSPACPECRRPGRSVERITLKALLRSEALERLAPGSYRFCATPTCGVVYFGMDGAFRREDLVVPVFQKEPPGERTVCYCFGITEADLRRDLARTGTVMASQRIAALVKADRCACEVRNPQGSCCLGNLVAAERAAPVPGRDGEGSMVSVR